MSVVLEPDKERITQVIRDHFAQREDVAAIYVFGSLAADRLTPASDIDIGVLYMDDAASDVEQFLSDRAELNMVLGRDIDLVRLNRAPPVLRYQVLKYGECVLTRHPQSVHRFFVRTINEYFDLKQSRRVIERSLRHSRILS